MEKKLNVFEPCIMHPATLADPRCTITDKEHGRLITYCQRNNVGAVYHVEPGMWCIYVPIDLPSFLGSLADRNITLPDGSDLQQWLDAVGAAPIDRGEAH